jgi:hypothetical protein
MRTGEWDEQGRKEERRKERGKTEVSEVRMVPILDGGDLFMAAG